MLGWLGDKNGGGSLKPASQRLTERIAVARSIDRSCILALVRVTGLFLGLDLVLFLIAQLWPIAPTAFFAVRLSLSAWFLLRFLLPVSVSLFRLRNRIVQNGEAGRKGEGREIVDFYWSQLGRDLSLIWRMWRA